MEEKEQHRLVLRISADLHKKIDFAAKSAGRSLTSEINLRLDETFEKEPNTVLAAIQKIDKLLLFLKKKFTTELNNENIADERILFDKLSIEQKEMLISFVDSMQKQNAS